MSTDLATLTRLVRDLSVRVRDLEVSNLELSRRVAHLEAEEFELLPDRTEVAPTSSPASRPVSSCPTASLPGSELVGTASPPRQHFCRLPLQVRGSCGS